MISTDDYLAFVDDALEGMIDIVFELGDDMANHKPDLPGANSPYAILTHCLGVMEYWAGHVVAGRVVERDRDAEFRASGDVTTLVERVRHARERFASDLADLEPFAPPRNLPPGDESHLEATQGGALIHVYEELAQHRGHMEGCRDVLLAPWVKLA